ncbi:molybdopterin-dependent oxidoreductase [Oerskovia sp. M15]
MAVSPREFPTNKGGLCQKGWTSASLLTASDRLTAPLVRDQSVDASGTVTRGELRPATWDEALGRVVDGIQAIQAESGRDAVAIFGGGD